MPLCGIRCRCSEMRRRPTARCVAMLRAYLVLSLVAVLFGAFVLAGCTDSNSPLPPLRAVDVTGLLIGPSGMILPILPVGEALPAVPRGVSLDELMEAYAHSQETDWEGDTTPQLSVVLLLEDGRICLLYTSDAADDLTRVGLVGGRN